MIQRLPIQRKDGIFDDERVLTLARAMVNGTDRLFSKLYAIAAESKRVKFDGDDVLKIFVNGLPSIQEWTQETIIRESKSLSRMHPRVEIAYRYALMKYVQELYSTEAEVEFTAPPFETFVWQFYKIASRKKHIKCGAFLSSNEKVSQQFVRNVIRDTFDRLLQKTLRIRQQQLTNVTVNENTLFPTRHTPSCRSKSTKRSIKQTLNKNIQEAFDRHNMNETNEEPVERLQQKESNRSKCPSMNENAEIRSTASKSIHKISGHGGGWGIPTRSRARELEALGCSRRVAAAAQTSSMPLEADDSGGIVLDGAGSDDAADTAA